MKRTVKVPTTLPHMPKKAKTFGLELISIKFLGKRQRFFPRLAGACVVSCIEQGLCPLKEQADTPLPGIRTNLGQQLAQQSDTPVKFLLRLCFPTHCGARHDALKTVGEGHVRSILAQIEGAGAPVPEVGGHAGYGGQGEAGHPQHQRHRAKLRKGVALEIGIEQQSRRLVAAAAAAQVEMTFEAHHRNGVLPVAGPGQRFLDCRQQHHVFRQLPKIDGQQHNAFGGQFHRQVPDGRLARTVAVDDRHGELKSRPFLQKLQQEATVQGDIRNIAFSYSWPTHCAIRSR